LGSNWQQIPLTVWNTHCAFLGGLLTLQLPQQYLLIYSSLKLMHFKFQQASSQASEQLIPPVKVDDKFLSELFYSASMLTACPLEVVRSNANSNGGIVHLASLCPGTASFYFYLFLFYFILFYFILFYFILFYFILFYFILFYLFIYLFLLQRLGTSMISWSAHPLECQALPNSSSLAFEGSYICQAPLVSPHIC
jgi:hypothetical protein